MKKIILIALSSLLFLSMANEASITDINQLHTQKMQKRLAELDAMLEKKAQEREEKSKIRDLKLQKLDDTLKEKAKKREDTDSEHNSAEIHAVLEKTEPLEKETLEK